MERRVERRESIGPANSHRPKAPPRAQRLQLRTVKELMEGKGIERPSTVAAVDETFTKAPESKKKYSHQKQFGI